MRAGRAGHRLKSAAQIARLVFLLPGLLVRAAIKYRAFRRAFVLEATNQGMPLEVAKQAAREMRPGAVLGGVKRISKSKEQVV